MTHFEVIREIGRGGFGVVEEVENDDGERFARKTFRPAPHIPQDAHDGLKKRFQREVKTQALLGGREILPVLTADLNAAAPWFLMPLADKTYEQQISDDKKSGNVNVNAVADILNGLQSLHELGFVHRDLNPKNILLHDQNWKLSDLGAVLPPSGHTVTLTEDTVIYTEQYCSPEQRNDFHAVQPASDVFAFGCILHDIFGSQPRIPYAQQSANGDIGAIIEKCTEQNPSRRPSVRVLRDLVLEALVEIGGHCKVEDEQSESWLSKLEDVSAWSDDDYANFARFFAQLNTKERTSGNETEYVHSLSTPFLTRIPAKALEAIVGRGDGTAGAIVEKYCEWVKGTAFAFHFADSICSRLVAIFDTGNVPAKAQAIIAMIKLGESHNRWYVMREMLRRCGEDRVTKEEARRIEIEIRTEEMESQFCRCIDETQWNRESLAGPIARLFA